MVIKLTMPDAEFQEWRLHMEREAYISLEVSDTTAVINAMEILEMNPECIEVSRDREYILRCCETCQVIIGCPKFKYTGMYIDPKMYSCVKYLQE